MSDEKKSAHQELAEWVEAQIAGQPEVCMPTIADAALAHFGERNGFLLELFRGRLRAMVYDCVQRVVGESRGRVVQLGDTVVTREALRERASQFRRKWEAMYEHAGERSVAVLDMTSEDLALAEEERLKRSEAEHTYARLWRLLRSKLGTGERVRDRFSPEQVETAYRMILESKRKAGRDRATG